MCTVVTTASGKEFCVWNTWGGLVSLSVTLSMFSAALVVGLYFGVSSYSLIFSLPKPEYNGGKWTPFRGGMTKVMQEILLNIVNMNLIYWLMYFVAESERGAPIRALFHMIWYVVCPFHSPLSLPPPSLSMHSL